MGRVVGGRFLLIPAGALLVLLPGLLVVVDRAELLAAFDLVFETVPLGRDIAGDGLRPPDLSGPLGGLLLLHLPAL